MTLAGFVVHGTRLACATAGAAALIPIGWLAGDRLGGIVGPYIIRRFS